MVDQAGGDEIIGDLRPVKRNVRSFGVHGFTLFAAALAIGIAVGRQSHTLAVWPWLGASAAMLFTAIIVPSSRPKWKMLILPMSLVALGAAWYVLRHEHFSPDDLAARIGNEAILMRVQGRALAPPVTRTRTAGALARFDYREPATYFPMKVEVMMDRDGASTLVTGEVLVRVDESVPPFHTGDRIRVVGMLNRPGEPRNPGEFDYREYAKSLGQAGFLSVHGRDLLTITPAPRHEWLAGVMSVRDELRRRAGAWLLADLPQTPRTERNSLLVNLLLGQRDEQIDGVDDSFRRVGLAHILAISGFHLAVLTAFALMIARALGGYRSWHGWLVIAIILVYLALVEVRMPVLRAGVMTIAACLGLSSGRHLRAGGLVSFSAILLLLWRPDQLFDAGFQLTYATVLGLIYLAPPLRKRWFGAPDPTASTTGEMLGEWLKSALVVSVAAWAVATPIAAFHFGTIAPLAVLLSLIAVPLSAFILAVGYLKMILSAVLPSAALLLGIPLSISSDALVGIVSAVDGLPGSMFRVPFPSALWSCAALAWVCWCVFGSCDPRAWRGAAKWAALLGLIAWLCAPLWISNSRLRLRIDMLAVGDGSCYVIRSAGKTVVFDAGSSTDLNVGRRSLVPAMRRLGVRSIDTIAVTHADLDHYSGVLELAGEFGAGQVLVTPQFMAEARSDPFGSVAWMVEGITQRRIAVRTVGAGETMTVGESRWTWLHPAPDVAYDKANNSSMVIRIDCADRRVLLCGDIQQEAMNILMRDPDSLRADIMELPHHGSHHDVAESFIDRVNPSVILQSTGWTRWQNDKWAAKLSNKMRLVTVRDGACWVEIDDQGNLKTGTFIRHNGQ